MEDPQVTSKTPTTKRVSASKVIAEAQKRLLSEAQSIIEQAKKADPVAEPPSDITTTQWLSVITIIVSLVGVYYKHKEIKKVFAKPPY